MNRCFSTGAVPFFHNSIGLTGETLSQKWRSRAGVQIIVLFLFLLTAFTGYTQPVDYSNCPTCNTNDISFFSDVQNKYQGIRGINPSSPSTFNLIGNRKFSGGGFPVLNPFFGENWYPLRTEKQHLTGVVYRFGVSNYGDESDWNIHILPDNGFEDFVTDAIPYRKDNWYASADWGTSSDGHILIEAEITPDESRYGNPWFSNSGSQTTLLNRRVTVYGPFVREESHGNHPEIHPSEQIWWKEADNTHVVLLLNDDSNRFDDRADTVIRSGSQATVVRGDYTARRVTTYAYQPWSPNKKQDAELWVAFELNPALGGLKVDIQAIDDLNFFKDRVYGDVTEGDRYSMSYKGNVVLSVQESAPLDPFAGISFRNVCFNSATGRLQGFIVINTAVGNGNGKEGFVALHIDKRNVGLNARPFIVTGNLSDQWQSFAAYDEQVAFSDIISSDIHGKGIVDGMIDFNGNGKTDLFAKKGDRWLVLYDGAGTWQEINSSTIAITELRFGDIDGDRKTDILRVGPGNKIVASYGGIGPWTNVTDAGDQNSYFQVGDFNGDKRTDIIYLKYTSVPPTTPQYRADMYVKYGAAGSWKKLNSQYYLDNATDYNNMRFGDFNGDGITDIFRNSNGRFGVYWNGTGGFKEITRPPFAVKTDDLLFVNSLVIQKYTDVIHVDRISKQWSIFYKGYELESLAALKFNDPLKVRFGDIDPDGLWEPFAIDYVEERQSPATVNMNMKAAAIHEPVVMSGYEPGSLRRNVVANSKSLSMGLNVQYYPGSKNSFRKKPTFGNVEWVKNGANSQAITFVANPAFNIVNNEAQKIITVSQVPLQAGTTNTVQVKFTGQEVAASFTIPGLGLVGEKSNVRETTGNAGNWQTWNQYLRVNASASRSVLLDAAPAPPVKVKEVQFEVVPLYSSTEDGKITLEEIDKAATELNDIAYSYDTAKVKSIFSNRNIFDINWQFELKDMVTGAIMPLGNMVVTKGRWAKSKVVFPFPESESLLQLKATATITDEYGIRNIKPVEFIFYNQRINAADKKQIANWLEPIRLSPAQDGYIWVKDHWERFRANEFYFTYNQLLSKVQYLGEDGVLTPADLYDIIGIKLKER